MSLLYLIIIFVICLKFKKILAYFKRLFTFIIFTFKDIKKEKQLAKQGIKIFKPFGLTMFTGPQGSGKTISMVDYCLELKKKYPKSKLYANFKIDGMDGTLKNLNQLLKIRNGEDGVIFCIDEIQNEFSTSSSRNFPETMLSTITQQRKQRIHIVASSQVFTRVAKPIREQCYCVVDCRTFWNRWTRIRAYPADEYNSIIDSNAIDKKRKIHCIWKKSFIQSDELREKYDTYAVVDRMSRSGFAETVTVR